LATKSAEFIEHHTWKGKFVTDIWFDPNTCQYTSVVSNLDSITFNTVEEIKRYLDGTLEEWSNG